MCRLSRSLDDVGQRAHLTEDGRYRYRDQVGCPTHSRNVAPSMPTYPRTSCVYQRLRYDTHPVASPRVTFRTDVTHGDAASHVPEWSIQHRYSNREKSLWKGESSSKWPLFGNSQSCALATEAAAAAGLNLSPTGSWWSLYDRVSASPIAPVRFRPTPITPARPSRMIRSETSLLESSPLLPLRFSLSTSSTKKLGIIGRTMFLCSFPFPVPTALKLVRTLPFPSFDSLQARAAVWM